MVAINAKIVRCTIKHVSKNKRINSEGTFNNTKQPCNMSKETFLEFKCIFILRLRKLSNYKVGS